jgi:hypothetical protein
VTTLRSFLKNLLKECREPAERSDLSMKAPIRGAALERNQRQ